MVCIGVPYQVFLQLLAHSKHSKRVRHTQNRRRLPPMSTRSSSRIRTPQGYLLVAQVPPRCRAASRVLCRCPEPPNMLPPARTRRRRRSEQNCRTHLRVRWRSDSSQAFCSPTDSHTALSPWANLTHCTQFPATDHSTAGNGLLLDAEKDNGTAKNGSKTFTGEGREKQGTVGSPDLRLSAALSRPTRPLHWVRTGWQQQLCHDPQCLRQKQVHGPLVMSSDLWLC